MKYRYLLPVVFSSILFPFATANGQKVPTRLVTQIPKQALSSEAIEAAAANINLPIKYTPKTLKTIATANPLLNVVTRAVAYQHESLQAKETLSLFVNGAQHNLTPSQVALDTPGWKDPIVNQSLGLYLKNAIEANDYEAVIKELKEYYSIDESDSFVFDIPDDVFAANAVNYMTRHPHKITLRLREMLSLPYCNYFKDAINRFIAKDNLSLSDQELLYNLLKEAHRVHVTSLAETRASSTIFVPYRAYQTITEAVEKFVNETGRFPRFNAGPEERKLAIMADILLEHAEAHLIPPIDEFVNRLETLRLNNPLPILTKERLQEELYQYMKDTGSLFPLSWHSGGYSEREAILDNSYRYWLDKEWAQTCVLVGKLQTRYFDEKH